MTGDPTDSIVLGVTFGPWTPNYGRLQASHNKPPSVGDLDDLTIEGDATVYVDGELVDQDEVAN